MTVSNEFKKISKMIKQQDSKIMIKESLQNISKSEITYRFNGKLFSTIMKEIIVKTKDKSVKKGQNLNFKYGLYINTEYEYIDLGDYYIKDEPEQNKGSETLEITAYDKMVNFMNTFKQSDLKLTYPCTLLILLQKMCDICRVELYSTDFFHNDLNVDEDYFTAQQITYRDVLEKIAKTTLSTIYIKENKLYLAPISDIPVETLDRSYLTKLVITDKFGPVNSLVLGRGDVEDNVEARDDTSISQNGRCEIRFDENEFVEYQRENVINNMFQKIKGFTYYAFEGADLGIIWIEPATCIALKDNESDIYTSYYLSANILINTGIKSTIEAEILNETETEYKVTTDEEKKFLKVERMAKKNEGKISDLIQETSENSKKVASMEINVNNLTTKVSESETLINSKVEDIDRVNEALSGVSESINNLDASISAVKTDFETKLTETSKDFQFSVDEINRTLENGIVTNGLKNTSVDININGINVSKSDSEMHTLIDNEGMYVNKGQIDKTDTKNNILTADKDGVITENLYVRTYLTTGYHRFEGYEENGEKRTGIFYQGGDF